MGQTNTTSGAPIYNITTNVYPDSAENWDQETSDEECDLTHGHANPFLDFITAHADPGCPTIHRKEEGLVSAVPHSLWPLAGSRPEVWQNPIKAYGHLHDSDTRCPSGAIIDRSPAPSLSSQDLGSPSLCPRHNPALADHITKQVNGRCPWINHHLADVLPEKLTPEGRTWIKAQKCSTQDRPDFEPLFDAKDEEALIKCLVESDEEDSDDAPQSTSSYTWAGRCRPACRTQCDESLTVPGVAPDQKPVLNDFDRSIITKLQENHKAQLDAEEVRRAVGQRMQDLKNPEIARRLRAAAVNDPILARYVESIEMLRDTYIHDEVEKLIKIHTTLVPLSDESSDEEENVDSQMPNEEDTESSTSEDDKGKEEV